MISYEQALDAILKNTHILNPEKVRIEESIGGILGEDIYSNIEMPPFDKSAMDGFAVNSLNLKLSPVKLKCVGLIQAGEVFNKEIKDGECVKIMTGAALAKNTDSVVMVEDTKQRSDYVEIFKQVKKGENVCFKAEDLKIKEKVLDKGIEILPSAVAILATVGREFVKVIRGPGVSVLNTGGEIVPVGGKLSKFKIFNSNGPMLCSFLKRDAIQAKYLGIAKDKISDLKNALRQGLESDVFLISGGVSTGEFDLVPSVLKSMGVKEIFHKVNIKPGKPLFFGTKNKTLVFGIPGNPVSNFLAYLIFIRPTLNKMRGVRSFAPEFKKGRIRADLRLKTGRRLFILVKVDKKGADFLLTPVISHGSADVLALLKSDGFMTVGPLAWPEGRQDAVLIKKSSTVQFITWKTI